MQKKRAVIAALLILGIMLLSTSVLAEDIGCCITTDGCYDETNEASCGGTFDEATCAEHDDCQATCCVLSSTTIEARHKVACPPPFQSYLELGYSLFPHPLLTDQCMNCVEPLYMSCPPPEPDIMIALCSNGNYQFTENTCAGQVEIPEDDSDDDGILDDFDECPNEAALEKPEGLKENINLSGGLEPTWCSDTIDNDCDGLYDDYDSDCDEACVDGVDVIEHTCDDSSIITVQICEDGVWKDTYETCPEETASPTGVCGDGIVQTPNEAYFNEQCDGDINQGQGVQATADSFCSQGGTCLLPFPSPLLGEKCSCHYSCDEPTDVFTYVTVDPNLEDATPNNVVNWDISPSCPLKNFSIMFCKGCDNPNLWLADLGPLERSYSHILNPPPADEETEINYCYKIIAEYDGASVKVESDPSCAPTGDPECYEHPPGASWCNEYDPDNGENDPEKTIKHWCEGEVNDDGLTVLRVQNESCVNKNPSEYCAEVSEDTAECRLIPVCLKCNQVFQLFGMGTLGKFVCKTEDCSLDKTKTNADMFYPCGGIETTGLAPHLNPQWDDPLLTCYDYRSKNGCENSSKCFLDCVWDSSPEAYGEFGIGVCRPTEPADEKCSKCITIAEAPSDNSMYLKNAKFNRLFDWCIPDLCQLYGEGCLMSSATGGSCKNGADLGCRVYGNDEGMCGGGTYVDINTHYSGDKRDSGTNEVSTESADTFEFGLCTYIDGECFKDADENGIADCEGYTNFENFNWACEQDMMPPMTSIDTTVVIKKDGKPLLSKYVDLPVYASESGWTYFCFDKNNCYPTELTTCRIQKIFEEGEEFSNWDGGIIKLFYYTEDMHHNLEVVKSIDVLLDTVSPAMEVTISEQLTPTMDLTLTSTNSADIVTCYAHLESEEGIKITASPESPYSADINGEKGITFTRSFYNLRDDIYYFKYKCYDEAGNYAEGEKVMEVDTNSIHNPAPHGILKIPPTQISVDTDGSANCNYAPVLGAAQPDYDAMYPMEQTGGTHHVTPVPVSSGTGFHMYDIKCKFTEGGLEGERNDRVKFSIDNSGPVVIPTSSIDGEIPFDPDLDYSGQQTIYLQCFDEERNPDSVYSSSGVHNFDFGCKDVEYTLDSVTYTGESLPIGPLNFEETTIITYTATDNGSNTNTGTIDVDIDEDGPNATAEIIRLLDLEVLVEANSNGEQDPPPSSEPGNEQPIIGIGTYTIRLRANSIIQSAKALLSVPDMGIESLSLEQPQSTRLTEAVFEMNIPRVDTGDMVNGFINITVWKAKPGAQCTVDQYNIEEDPSSVLLNFTVDTFIPDIVLSPLFDNITKPIPYTTSGRYDFETTDHEYNLYKYTEKTPSNLSYTVYYTNQANLFVTGFVNPEHTEKTYSVRFYSAPKGNRAELADPKDEYVLESFNALVSDTGKHPEGCRIDGIILKGTTTVPITCQGGSGQLPNRKYILFEHNLEPEGTANDQYNMYSEDSVKVDRHKYGAYGSFYEIMSYNTGGVITLTEPLEKDITGGTEWYVFGTTSQPGKSAHPANWFGHSLYLVDGANTVFFQPVGKNGVLGEINGVAPVDYIVVLDTAAPRVIESTPRQGSTNKNITEVTFKVTEVSGGALLDEGSVSLTISENGGPANKVGVNISSKKEGLIYTYNIIHTRDSPFPDGNYTVRLTGMDKAGNKLVEDGGLVNFTFTRDEGYPDEPEWKFIPAYHLEEKNQWFTNVYPDIDLDFTSNDMPIELKRFLKLSAGESWPGGQVPFFECADTTSNYFDCHFTFTDANTGPDRPYMNNAYAFIIEAFKNYPPPEEAGPLGQFSSDMIILDNIAPVVETIDLNPGNVIAMNRNLTFYMTIPTERYSLNVTMYYQGDNKVYQLVETNNDNAGHYSFVWMVPGDYDKQAHPELEDPKDIILTIKDYAGNEPYVITKTIRLDLTKPNADTFVFNPLVPYNTTLQDGTQQFYTNNCTVNIVGSFTDDDIGKIVIAHSPLDDLTTIGSAHIDQATKTYSLQVVLEGELNESIQTNYEIIVQDEAGNDMVKKFEMYCDLEPPKTPTITVV